MTAGHQPTSLAGVMHAEADAIARAATRLTSNATAAAVGVLTGCKGKVIVTGVGKSGLVAQKLAASLTSVGYLAMYLNPLDALHGDIGIVREGDAVVLISNSGETTELIALLPFLEKRGAKTVGILGRVESSLARRCTAMLDASVAREAAPIEQVPTSSTAVAMAICDGLLVECIAARNVSVEEFALNHPAGAIGRRLTLTVGDVMIPVGKLQFVAQTAALPEVIEALTTQAIGAVLVKHVQVSTALGGIITDGDLRRLIERGAEAGAPGGSLLALTAADVMRPGPRQIRQSALAVEAADLMEAHRITSVLATDDQGRVVGALNSHDLMQAKVI